MSQIRNAFHSKVKIHLRNSVNMNHSETSNSTHLSLAPPFEPRREESSKRSDHAAQQTEHKRVEGEGEAAVGEQTEDLKLESDFGFLWHTLPTPSYVKAISKAISISAIWDIDN